MIVWHYTILARYALIEADGFIKPATRYVPRGEKPIVWFSMNQWWEQTANKAMQDENGRLTPLDMAQMAALPGGIVRIGVASETAPYDWKTLRELSGMSSKMAQGMYRAGIDAGARPSDWRGTFEPVPRDKWLAVEVFRDSEWVRVFPASEEQLQERKERAGKG